MNPSISKRLATWQVTHKQLLRADMNYRNRFRSYLKATTCLSFGLLIFYLPFFGVRLFTPVVDIAMLLGFAALIVGLTLRQFHYQRRSIRHYSRSPDTA